MGLRTGVFPNQIKALAPREYRASASVCFLQAISITQSGGPEEKLGLAFQLYDIDGNGHIEESEMNEIIKVLLEFF